MKVIKTFGLILFLIGFGIFLGSFFTSTYQLTETTLKENLSDEGKISALKQNSDIIGKTYNSNFTFVSELETAFEKVNSAQLNQFGISDEEIKEIIKINGDKFDIKTIDKVFDNTLIGRYKAETFKNYGSWLDGRAIDDSGEFDKYINEVAGNIKKYQILTDKGFDKYKIKELKFSLTKASSTGAVAENSLLFLFLTFGLSIVGALLYILPKIKENPPGIRNDGIFFSVMKNVKWLGIMTGTFLILFYIVLYFFPEYMTNWVLMVDPVSEMLSGNPAGQFFLYGFLYTLCILVMGIRMIIKYRHSKYQIVRTVSVMFFQTAFAFIVPEILVRLNKPYFDFKNMWPLDYDFFFETELNTLIESGSLGIFMLTWGIALFIIGVPVFVFFFGKRWYCSWVCGCGGLAETLGDPYRQLSNKSLKAWKIERWMIHSVLVFAVVMTAGVLYSYWTESDVLFGLNTKDVRAAYGSWIGAGFAGVVGTGFYPIMGNRVWCRFGCPLAAYLGIVQKFKSKFRITTNGGQCISCGNCSTHCEMGIDVRWYAQRGQNIVRSSCVGCGVCSAVCPRGVLNLENTTEEGRYNEAILIGNDSLKIQK